ncbi:isopeptide-forming domain-containing fimbrial protein [Bacillus cereus group sp. MYBK226-2]|uniref:isopeptide-forming domain-containing fimbrial protein n=1 Tax=Bacillus cereus group sp. MYBK226-2 TaxID=3450655 RepID=UPI003F7A7404
MKKSLKCFNVVTIIALLLSITLPSPSAFAEIHKKSWDELQGNDVRIKAEQVNAEIYRGEVAEREHVFQYTIENTGDTPIQELVLKQNNENEITFLSQSMKVNGEKLPENKVADFYVEEKDKGGKLLSSNLKIRDLKSHEKMTVLIKASRTQHFNKEYKQKISVQKDQVQIGSMSFDVEGIPSEDKVEATADDEADSSKEEVGPSPDSTTKKITEKLKVSVEDKNKSTSKTELPKQPVTEAEKQPEKEVAKQSNAEVQAASENASKVQIQVGDKQGFGDPLYSTIAAGNLVQTGNVTLGLTTDHYGRQSLGYKTNKMTVDVDNDDSTFNSSTGAFPNIPAGSKVKKAYLFWTAAMGVPGNIANRKVTEDQVRQPVKMKMGNKEYTEVSADSIRKADSLPYISNYSGSGAGYVAYADVTDVIAQQGISQTLTVANVPQIKDVTGGGYYWGNWNLILVYENYKETVKDMKIWEGLVSQKSTAWTDISVNKINTPKEGAFKAKFSYFSSQGDPAEKDIYAYDYGEYDFGAGYVKIKNINGKDNDVNDSSMTEVQVDGTNEFVTKKYPGYNPDWTNSFSTDIHTYHLEGPNQVKNDLKEAKMRFRANGATGDIYVLNNATFVTEHNAPNLQVDKKALDSAGKEIKEVKAGEEITYQIEVKNDTKNNQAPVSNVKGFDKLDDRLEYVPGSIQYVTGSNTGQKTDDASDDEAEFVNNQIDFRIGEGADAKDGGVLKPGESAILTFKVKVKESIKSDTTVKNVVAVKGQDSAEIKYESEDDANVTVTIPKEVPGEIEARKIASNKSPKLGDEVEYRITFKNKVKDGRLDVLTIEDKLPSSLEFVKDSLKAEGVQPEPVELKFENGKIIAKYPAITDMEERSIVFKTKVKETAKIGEEIVNKAIVSDKTNPPKNIEEKITPDYKDGKVDVDKSVTNQTPKLGEEVEYRITFHNTVENGKLENVLVEDTLPKDVEYVKDSLKAEGIKPEPVELKMEDGKIIAKYPEITDMEKRSIVFKVKVKDSAKVGEVIVNKAIAKDPKHDPVDAKVVITPQSKKGEIAATKVVNNEKPKLGEEIEYRISFHNMVENGKLAEVRVEDTIPKGLEYVENSIKAEGEAPSPVELTVEAGVVKAKYIDITDTKERSIVFKVKVKEEVEVGKEIVNKAIVDDTKHQPIEPEERITPQHKDGIINAAKIVDNPSPKLGEEVEYRISFKNTVENGKLEKVKIEDTIPNGLEYVKGSEKAEGDKPAPVKLHVKDGKVIAEYENITDTKERSIVFKVKVKEEAEVGKEIVNQAIVDDTKDSKKPEAKITPLHKDGKIKAKKSVNNETPKLGEEVEYRISFKNTVENGKLAEVKIEDTLPEGVEYVENSLKAEGAGPNPVELKMENGKVLAKYPEITDIEERSITFKVKVKEEVKVGEKIVNKAIVDDTKHDPINPKAEITPQYKDGKIEAEKVVNNPSPKLEEEVEYRISFKNTVEHGKLAEVIIEDDLPNGLEYVKGSLQAEGSKPNPVELKFENGKVLAKYPEITDTKERSITFKVKVKGNVSDTIVNQAIVSDTKHPPETPKAEIIPQHKDGKLEAKKVVNNLLPKLGEEVEYRISFKNTVENGKLAEVKIEDQLPAGLEYVKDSLKAEGNEPNPVELKEEDGKITAKYENITDTAERSISFKVKVTEAVKVGKTIVNKAIVDDHNPKNPLQKPEAIITPEYKDGKLKAEKTVNNSAPKLGEEVEYRITFRNVVEHGKVAKVKIKDELPTGLEFVEGSERAEGENPKPLHVKVKNGIVLAEYPEIVDTKERSIIFKVKVKEKAKVGEEIVNTAVVEDTINPPEQPNIAIQPQYKDGALQAEKTVSNHEPKLGEEVEYRISFENTVENGRLTEVKVEDEIPAGLEYVQDSIKSDGSEPNPVELKVENGKVTAKYPEITDMKKRSIIFKVKVQETVQVGKEIINKAIVDDNNPTTPPVESLIPITPQYKDGKLEARKEVSNHEPKLGEEIEYRITFNGTVDGGKLVDVKIEDEIPAGLEYVKDSLEAVGDKPVPTELKVENGKVTAKYPEITDTKERSIIFKAKVKETVKVGGEITNKAIIHVDDPNHPVIEPTATIKPEYKDGKLKATKAVSNKEPKLGEEVEYRISFKNTVENGKVAEVKVEDEIPAGLEYVQDSLRFEGAEPNPVELKVEFGKVIAKYLDIADRKERSIIFKAKVKETVETGKKIVNKAIVGDTINQPEEPVVSITPQYKDGMLKAEKEVSNKEPKLGEEVEYRISFKNTVENGKLAEVKIEDQLPDGLEYVKDSVKAKGAIEVKVENGKLTAKYENIIDTKERNITFKVKVKEKAGEEIVNRAIVDDGINQPLEPTVSIKPKEPEVKPEDPKEPEVKPEDPKEPEVKPEDPKEPKEPEVKPEDPKEPEVKPEDPKEPEVKPEDPKEPEVKPEDPKEPEVKPEDPKEPEVKPEDPKEPEVKPEDPKEPEVKPEDPKEPEVKPEDPKEPEVKPEDPKEPEVKPEDPKEPEVKPEDPKEPEVKPEDPKEPEVKPEDLKEPEVKPENPKKPEVKLEKPEVRLEKLIKEPQVKVERELPKTGAASPWMMSVGAGISFLVGGVLFVLGRRRKQ